MRTDSCFPRACFYSFDVDTKIYYKKILFYASKNKLIRHTSFSLEGIQNYILMYIFCVEGYVRVHIIRYCISLIASNQSYAFINRANGQTTI